MQPGGYRVTSCSIFATTVHVVWLRVKLGDMTLVQSFVASFTQSGVAPLVFPASWISRHLLRGMLLNFTIMVATVQ